MPSSVVGVINHQVADMAKKKRTTKKRPMGRPTKFNPKNCEQITKLCMLGATDKELGEFYCVTEKTINNWKKNDDFLHAIKKGKAVADAEVAAKLYHRATGYEHEDVHVSNYQGDITLTPLTKHYPPDSTACIFWLKNRRRGEWPDRQEHEHSGAGGGPIKTEDIGMMEAARRIAFLLSLGAARAT